MIINRSEGARRLGITKQALDNLRKRNPVPGFFVEVKSKSGKEMLKIDDEHPEWILKLKSKDFENMKTGAKTNKKVGPKKKAGKMSQSGWTLHPQKLNLAKRLYLHLFKKISMIARSKRKNQNKKKSGR